MFVSMTGYGSASEVFKSKRGRLEFFVELKTVNSKFLDVNVRSPKPYAGFEASMIETLRKHLRRGRVELTLNVRVLEGSAREISVNLEQARALMKSYQSVVKSLGLAKEIQLSDMLKLPDWLTVQDSEVNEKAEWPMLEKVLLKAIKQLTTVRQKEGESLKKIIQKHRKDLGDALAEIDAQSETMLKQFRSRTHERLKALMLPETVDAQRLEQELSLWITRSDFREEMDRLHHHLKTMDHLISEGGELGRKMDFLTQELHREVNTLGSKCPEASVTPRVIQMKTAIERIKEQIQNIE